MNCPEPHREAITLRAENESLARLTDAGKLLFAKLIEKSRENRWLKINVQIIMREL
jgi:hypothetical protein